MSVPPDEYALEIMKDQKRAKRKAPVDYGITGFDNIDTLAYVTPQLSTISNVVDEVARGAVEMLFFHDKCRHGNRGGKEPRPDVIPPPP